MPSSFLAGRRVAVTRALPQATELCALLIRRNATPLVYPRIRIAPPEDSWPQTVGWLGHAPDTT